MPGAESSHEQLCHLELDSGLEIVQADMNLGNVDPRFGDLDAVRAARRALRSGLRTPLNQIFTVTPQEVPDAFVDLNVSNERVTVSQVYPDGNERGTPEFQVQADAMVTDKLNVGLMLNTADCLPLVVHQPGLLAMIHVGRHGAVNSFHEKVMDYMREMYGLDPGVAQAYIGAGIQSESYVFPRLTDIDPTDSEWKSHVTESDKGFHIDIPSFVVRTLKRYGFSENKISKSTVDTGAENSRHFSHTRFKKNQAPRGRNGFIAVAA